jgi:hypothetical protein
MTQPPSTSNRLRDGVFSGPVARASTHTHEAVASKVTLVLLPFEPGRKTRHLAVVEHRGGGWYDVRCMGAAKRCAAGECQHTADMRWQHSNRPIRQVPR